MPLTGARMVCRPLSGFSLPASAGLLHRPILLTQTRVADEIRHAAVSFHAGAWPEAAAWHLSWFPRYDACRPQPLWRPRVSHQAVGDTCVKPAGPEVKRRAFENELGATGGHCCAPHNLS